MTDHLNTRFAEGDEAALTECLRTHGPLIRSYLRRFVRPQDVEDLQQVVFAEVWRSRHRFDPERSLPAWMLGIAHKRAVDQLRVRTFQTVPLDVIADPVGDDGRDDGEQLAERDQVRRALARLPEPQRQAIELAYYDDLTQREISEKLSIPLGTIKARTARGLRRLSGILGTATTRDRDAVPHREKVSAVRGASGSSAMDEMDKVGEMDEMNGTGEVGRRAVRPRVAVSSCLMGEPVRFDGGHSRNRFLNNELDKHVEWVHICPEMEIGLGSPRETLRLERSPEGTRLVTRKSRVDLTDRMTALAAQRVPALLEVDGYILKSKSPSCGVHGIPVHAGGTTVGRKGRGVFAGVVLDAYPLLPVEDEGRLNDALLRENFVERIFARARLRALLESDWRPRDLVSFHARHKMQLLAHDPVAFREAGRLVAGAGTRPREELASDYTRVFDTAFATKASIGRHVNVLQHCVGMVGDALDPARRADLAEIIASYRAGQVALSVPATLIRHHAQSLAADYVRDQTYFSPYPEDLRLRNHVAA
ncbi:DUF1722 domain-containing protein [Streptosporangium sp. NPDC000095]|uniref:DUF1722 domain-containing protein n=1 Tax=Streptosporangium sp. NPDC000095 TaxID=3366184 RepID=UPI0036C1F626